MQGVASKTMTRQCKVLLVKQWHDNARCVWYNNGSTMQGGAGKTMARQCKVLLVKQWHDNARCYW